MADLVAAARAAERNYRTALRCLYSVNLFQRVKIGLANMEALDRFFGHPHRSFRTVHVAGTNGKGSTCWKVEAALRAAGLRTGIFVSPHISSFRERIRVDGELISEEAVRAGTAEVMRAAAAVDAPATFFELTAALALNHFQREQVDVVVLETGLGGRLDATNVVDADVSVVTSIGYDHTHILGHTIRAIATEKAGIMKRGRVSVVGPDTPQMLMGELAAAAGVASFVPVPPPAHLVRGLESAHSAGGAAPAAVAAAAGWAAWFAADPAKGLGTPPSGDDVLRTHLPHALARHAARLADGGAPHQPDVQLDTPGWELPATWRQEDSAVGGDGGGPVLDYDATNRLVAATALHAFADLHPGSLDVGSDAVGAALWATPPCRMERVRVAHTSAQGSVVDVEVVLDAGHNADALRAALRRLQPTLGPRVAVRAVFAMSDGRDVGDCAQAISAVLQPHQVHCTESASTRTVPAGELAAALQSAAGGAATPGPRVHTRDAGAAGVSAVHAAIGAALEELAAVPEPVEQRVLLVFGSLFMMCEARAAVGIVEPVDPIFK